MCRILRFSLALLISMFPLGAIQALELDTLEKQFSYTLGYQYIQQFNRQGTKIDMEVFSAAANDVMQGNSLRMSKEEMSAAMQAYRQGLEGDLQAKAEAKLQAGKLFLEKNKNQPGVVVLPSGLQYIEHQAGKGGSPSSNSKVNVHYRGALIDGTEFDSSYNKSNEPASFELKGVIRGFLEALTLMKPGAKWTVFIPSHLGYGVVGSGHKIGPHETLIFEIELISVE